MFENRRFYSIFSTNYKYLLSSIYNVYIVYVKNTERYLHRLTLIPIFEHNCFDLKIFILRRGMKFSHVLVSGSTESGAGPCIAIIIKLRILRSNIAMRAEITTNQSIATVIRPSNLLGSGSKFV